MGYDDGTLEAIEANRRKVEDCLTDLISHWLRNTKPKPTRSALTAALQSEQVAFVSGMAIRCTHKSLANNSILAFIL